MNQFDRLRITNLRGFQVRNKFSYILGVVFARLRRIVARGQVNGGVIGEGRSNIQMILQ